MKPLTYAAALSPTPKPGVAAWDPASRVGCARRLRSRRRLDVSNWSLRRRRASARCLAHPGIARIAGHRRARLLEFARTIGIDSLGDNAANYGIR